jgi:hypothetical protein
LRDATPQNHEGTTATMTRIPFTRSPVFATVSEGLTLAAAYWRGSIERWLLAVVAVAVANGLVAWLFGGTAIDQQTMSRALVPGASGPAIDPSELPRLLAGPLAVGLVSIVAKWFLVANAIAGLRGSEVTLPWVLRSGLRALVADMLFAMIVLALISAAVAFGTVGLIVLLGFLPVLAYVAIRLQFWALAIFDGSSIAGGLSTSWALTRRSVLRMLGWGLAVFGISLLLVVLDFLVSLLLAAVPVAPEVITAAVDTSFLAFSTIVLAILYESQRLRALAGAVVPSPPVTYPRDADGPLEPPPPPPPPPSDPWTG